MGVISIEILMFFVSVFITGLITAAEIALSSFGENKIEELKDKGDNIWQKFDIVHKNPEPFYGTIHLLSLTFLISFKNKFFVGQKRQRGKNFITFFDVE